MSENENGVFTSNEEGETVSIVATKWGEPEDIGKDGWGRPVTIRRPLNEGWSFHSGDSLLGLATALHDRIAVLEAKIAKLEGDET